MLAACATVKSNFAATASEIDSKVSGVIPQKPLSAGLINWANNASTSDSVNSGVLVSGFRVNRKL